MIVMSRSIPALPFLLLSAWVVVPSLAAAQEIPSVTEMRAKAEAFVKRAYPAFEPTRARVEYADLNGDGLPEAFVILRDAKSCGEDGCALVLDIAADTAREIATLAGNDLRALQTKSSGWRDISLDGRRLRWRNGSYE